MRLSGGRSNPLGMTLLGFRRSILIDASVNLVPFGILVFFLLLILVVNPWRLGGLSLIVSVGVLAIPIVVLLVATWVAARVLQTDQATTDRH